MAMKGMDLWKLRKEAGLTQRQLAKLIGKNSTWICRREQNNDHPDWMPITKEEEKLIRSAISRFISGDKGASHLDKHGEVSNSDGWKVISETWVTEKDDIISELNKKIENLLDSIANNCFECRGGLDIKEIRYCEVKTCELWQHRPFQKND